jgi:hypothetical protein
MRLHPCGHTFCYNCIGFLMEISNGITYDSNSTQSEKLK